jgi:hypothetical protein
MLKFSETATREPHKEYPLTEPHKGLSLLSKVK